MNTLDYGQITVSDNKVQLHGFRHIEDVFTFVITAQCISIFPGSRYRKSPDDHILRIQYDGGGDALIEDQILAKLFLSNGLSSSKYYYSDGRYLDFLHLGSMKINIPEEYVPVF